MKRVLVAVEESDASRRVAAFVNYFFDGMDVEILAINVAPTAAPWIPAAMGWGGLYEWPYSYWIDPTKPDPLDEAEREAKRKSEQTVKASGIHETETVTKIGDPVVAIRRAATERDVDVIVVGSHDKNFLRRIVSPSVSRELAHKANRPVLIVP